METENFVSEKPTKAVLEILENLKPETRRKFISRMKKAIDIDGNLVLLVYNKAYFGTGNFQDVSIKVGDLRLDTNNSTKDKPFTNQLKIDLLKPLERTKICKFFR